MNEDVAKLAARNDDDVSRLVERLEADLARGCAAPARDIKAAASTIRAQAAEIERLREDLIHADLVIQRLNSGAELQAIMAAHSDTLEKLRDAVEVIRKLMQHEPDHADAIWQDARAFLTDMEKTDGP